MRHGPARATVAGSKLKFRFRTDTNATYCEAPVHNLGPGGISANIQPSPDKDTVLQFELVLGANKVIRGQGRVAWTATAESRSGLCFIDLDDHAQRIVDLWLAQQS